MQGDEEKEEQGRMKNPASVGISGGALWSCDWQDCWGGLSLAPLFATKAAEECVFSCFGGE